MGTSWLGRWAVGAAGIVGIGSLAAAGPMVGQATGATEPLPEHEEIMAYAGTWDVVVDGHRVGSATARGRVGERLMEFELRGDLGPVSRVSYLLGFDRRHREYSVLAFDDSGDYWVSGRGPREGGTIRAAGVDDDPRFAAMGLTKEFVLVVALDSTWTAEGRDAPTSVRFETRFVDTRTPARDEIPFLSFALRRSSDESAGSDPADDVRRVALDYLDAFYQGDDELLRRAVHPDVSKLGFYRETVDERYQQVPMPFDEMLEFNEAVRAGRVNTPADAPREATVLDVADQTAVVRVDAWWGHDYLHLARFDGRWMIIHVLWQSPLR